MNIKFYSVLVIIILLIGILPENIIPSSKEQYKPQIIGGEWINENTFKLSSNSIEIYSETMAYFDNNSNSYQKIDLNIQNNSLNYFVEKGIYKVYFSKSLISSCIVTISKENDNICWKPMNIGYIDISNYKIQKLRNFNYSNKVVINVNKIIYKEIFGKGIDLQFTIGTNSLKEELIISNSVVNSFPNPNIYGFTANNTYLGLISSYQTTFNLKNINYSTINQINLKNDNKTKIIFPISFATSNSLIEKVRNIFITNTDNKQIASGVSYNWLMQTNDTVIIDPTTTIQPASKDTLLNQGAPTTNYGSNNVLAVESACGAGCAGNYNERTIIDFSLTSLPTGAIITSSTLSLYYENSAGSPSGRTVWVYPIIGAGVNWVQAQATWNVYSTGNNWGTAGGDYSTTNGASTTVPSSTNVWMNWTVTSLVSSFWSNGTTTHFLLKDGTEGNNPAKQELFWSSDYAVDTTKRPKLVINYIDTFYVKTYLHTGISSVKLNGTSISSNGTETGYNISTTSIINATAYASAGYVFYYFDNNGVIDVNNPYYFQLLSNVTLNIYAIAPSTTTTTVTTTITTTVTTTVTTTITSTSTTISTSTITSTTILSNIVCANTTTTTSRTYAFFDGFESGNFSKWNLTASGSGGSISVVNNTSANGTYSANAHATTSGSFAYAKGTANFTSIGNDFWTLFYVKISPIAHDPTKTINFFELRNSTHEFLSLGLYHHSTGGHSFQIKLTDPNLGILYEQSAKLDINNNAFQRIELHFFKNASNGYIKMYLNGTLITQFTVIKTSYSAYSFVSMRVGITSASSGLINYDVWIDSVYVDGSRIGLSPYTCIYLTTTTTILTTDMQVLPNNTIPNLFYIGVFAGVIFILGIVAVVLRRRYD